ncbi:sugar phosphate isomerase/epimerase [Microbacteriaceae bacterium SG_E_30_P1]|uniref:Sugar phosphate isomerase/epimerase n=1 Tax=Antiquaquibacter oligotrophicus TaxID=2880260 RepID=A0ABT6KPP4_9MICO|nr:sugar phosphate isomerase/epimerase [Antiquaquibacter oligotrophicus]MDH6181953.1 sugar phosphate isomerase/epimerase [Antiquaquibacter oligotrophicus]UDF12377.1 sugar phosphate isomerase/epimerase [Antiquaquibacter oligotrophicus]
MSTPPLSVQLYTVRDAVTADADAAFTRLAEIGFRSVELYDFVDRAAQYKSALSASGLTPSSAHASLLGKDVVPVFEAAKSLGIRTVIDPMVEASRWEKSDDVVAIADELNGIAAIAADLDLTVGYHNHWWELASAVDGTNALEAFADNLDPSVILEIDTYWSAVGGVDPVGLLERQGDRVRFIHVKDGDISRDNTKQVAVGSGRMPVLDILAAAPSATRVVELDDFAGDVFDALADSVAFLIANGESL